jgi:hypothetical protein
LSSLKQGREEKKPLPAVETYKQALLPAVDLEKAAAANKERKERRRRWFRNKLQL